MHSSPESVEGRARHQTRRSGDATNVGAHHQDEIYVIVRGRGALFHDGRRDPFEAGDVMFVAAGVEHRFEDFTEDLAVWVVFYGPAGGEA